MNNWNVVYSGACEGINKDLNSPDPKKKMKKTLEEGEEVKGNAVEGEEEEEEKKRVRKREGKRERIKKNKLCFN